MHIEFEARTRRRLRNGYLTPLGRFAVADDNKELLGLLRNAKWVKEKGKAKPKPAKVATEADLLNLLDAAGSAGVNSQESFVAYLVKKGFVTQAAADEHQKPSGIGALLGPIEEAKKAEAKVDEAKVDEAKVDEAKVDEAPAKKAEAKARAAEVQAKRRHFDETFPAEPESDDPDKDLRDLLADEVTVPEGANRDALLGLAALHLDVD